MSSNTALDALTAKVDALAGIVAALAEQTIGVQVESEKPAEKPARKPAARKPAGKPANKRKPARWNVGMYARYGIEPTEGFTFESRSGNTFRVISVHPDYVLTERV